MWDDECDEAFRRLKEYLTCPSISSRSLQDETLFIYIPRFIRSCKECGVVEKRTLGRNASLLCEHVDDYRRTKVQQVTSNKAGFDNCGS
jgi:uncharacterized Zn finger protein